MSNDYNPEDIEIEITVEKPTKKRKTIKKQIKNTEIVETEVIESISDNEIKQTVQNLLDEYNKSQDDGFNESFIISNYTISGMDEINKMVAEAALQIDEFANNGKPEGFFSRITSTAIKTFDPKDSWIGKWAKGARDNAKRAEFEGKTPDEIVSSIKKAIEDKRQEIQKLVSNLFKEKNRHIERIKYYENVSLKAKNILVNTKDDTEENFNAKMLVTMIEGNIIELKSTIETDINPLIAGAKISVERIGAKLPSLASKLKGKLNIKAIQQQLSDLNSITQVATDLSNMVDEKVTQSVQETTLQTLDMLKDTGVDISKLKNKIKRDEEFKKKLLAKVDDVKTEVNKEFENIQQISNSLISHNKNKTELFLESYSNSELVSKE